jgi:hypothetical protein
MTTENDDIILMSSDAGEDPAPVQDPDPAPADPVDPPADPDPTPAAEAGDKKTPWYQARFNELTDKRRQIEAQLTAEREQREALEKRAKALQDLLLAQGHDPAALTGDTNTQPRTLTQADVEARAAQIAEERVRQQQAQAEAQVFNQRCNDVFAEGTKTFGPGFQEAIGNLNMAGVISADNTAIVQAALDTDNAAAILHHLGQDPAEAVRLASMPPVRLGMELAKISAQLNKPADPAPISKAPKPIAPVAGDRARDNVDIYSDDVDDASWFAEMEKRDRARS